MKTSQLERAVPYEQLPEFLTPDEFRSYMGLGRNTVYDLSQRLGHARVEITLNTYAHVLPDIQKQAARDDGRNPAPLAIR